MKKNLLFIVFIIFTVSASINSYASYEGHEENLGREGPPPAGPYRLGYKELERAIKSEKKGKIKKAKIKYEKALEYFLKALLLLLLLYLKSFHYHRGYIQSLFHKEFAYLNNNL